MFDQKGGSSGLAAKWMAEWLESTGYARMKVQSDAEQSIEHLLKAVKSICTADLIVQRAPVKSHQSQGHVEEQYDRLRISTEPCILTQSGFSTDTSHTKEGRHHSNVSQEVHTDLRFFRCSRRWSVGTIRSKTWRSSRGCERDTTNISINVSWSHRGKR